MFFSRFLVVSPQVFILCHAIRVIRSVRVTTGATPVDLPTASLVGPHGVASNKNNIYWMHFQRLLTRS